MLSISESDESSVKSNIEERVVTSQEITNVAKNETNSKPEEIYTPQVYHHHQQQQVVDFPGATSDVIASVTQSTSAHLPTIQEAAPCDVISESKMLVLPMQVRDRVFSKYSLIFRNRAVTHVKFKSSLFG